MAGVCLFVFWFTYPLSCTVSIFRNEQLYCENDYMSQFVPVCARCDKYIMQVEYIVHTVLMCHTAYNVRSVSRQWTSLGTLNTSSAMVAWYSSLAP